MPPCPETRVSAWRHRPKPRFLTRNGSTLEQRGFGRMQRKVEKEEIGEQCQSLRGEIRSSWQSEL